MKTKSLIDIKENNLMRISSELLCVLLKDMSTGNNIIWATDMYAHLGYGFQQDDAITVRNITGKNGNVIKPRIEKSKSDQQKRIRTNAEVFTPAWICNCQNNLIDNAWFDAENVFNIETNNGWTVQENKIPFPTKDGKTWQDYVTENRLEITCGEAPYLASRYDTVTGVYLHVNERIGLLDRKLRVVCENVDSEPEWYAWAKRAIQSVYGYDWQGDNVLLARENLLYTFCDFYEYKFGVFPINEYLKEIARILAWNIWQMDGLKFVVPNSCKNAPITEHFLWGEEVHEATCEGCRKNNRYKHNGIYCYVMDWEKKRKVKFVNLMRGRKK